MRAAASSRSAFGTRRSLSGNATLSMADSHGRRFASWKIMPTLRGMGAVIGSPSHKTTPLEGCRSPATSESSVDLPHPLGPTTDDELAVRDLEVDAVEGGHARPVRAEALRHARGWRPGARVTSAASTSTEPRLDERAAPR